MRPRLERLPVPADEMRLRLALWSAVARLPLPASLRLPLADFVATFLRGPSRERSFLTNPGARPFFDGSVKLSANERADYELHSRFAGYVDEKPADRDEGPDQPEPGTAAGEQGTVRRRS